MIPSQETFVTLNLVLYVQACCRMGVLQHHINLLPNHKASILIA